MSAIEIFAMTSEWSRKHGEDDVQDRKWSRRELLTASTALAAGALFAEPLRAGFGGSASPMVSGAVVGWSDGFDVAPGHLNRMPVWAAHAGQLAGVMIPYWWILR